MKKDKKISQLEIIRIINDKISIISRKPIQTGNYLDALLARAIIQDKLSLLDEIKDNIEHIDILYK